MADVRIFLSTVSAEFRSYRDALRRDLQRPSVTVMVQEDFIPTGTETLDKLDEYIRHCDAVIHLVGDMTGAMAQEPSAALIRQRYPDFGSRLLPVADFLKPGAPPLSYTQWEAWLALYHGKPLVIAVPEDGAPRDARYRVVEAERAAQQEHLQRLTAVERYPEVRFVNADRLAVEVLRSKLHEIVAETGGTSTVAAYHWPAPWDFGFGPYMAQKREGFEGREWLFRDIAVWLADSRSRALLVQADFGVGKSAFMAELVQRNPGGCIAAFHFCRHDTQDTLHPGYFVRSVATQLAAALPAYKALIETDATLQERLNRALEDPGSTFEGSVLAPLAKLAAPGRPWLLLVDALDESLELDAETARRSRGIVDLLGTRAGRFPPWLKVLATTRSNPDVLRRLDGFAPRLIDAESAANVNDLRCYVLHCAARKPLAEQLREAGTTVQALADLLAEKSQGKFLLTVRAVRALEEDSSGGSRHMRLDELAALPPGMDAWYFDAFERRYARAGRDYESTRAVLGVLAAAREPLSIETVAAVLGVEPRAVKAVRQLLPDFLQLRAGRLAFDHFSMAEWLTREDEQGFPRAGGYAVDVPASQAKLRGWALAQIAAGTAHQSSYLLRHLASHLAGDAERRHFYGELMLQHFEWLQARLDQDGVDALLADVEFIKGLPEQPWLQTVFRNGAHVLRTHPEQLAAQVLGRVGHELGIGHCLSPLAESLHRYLADPAIRLSILLPTSRSLRLATGHVVTIKGGHSALASLPDGRLFLGGDDGTVRVWDSKCPGETLLFEGHTDRVNALAVLPDGRVASGSSDGTVRVWNPQRLAEPLLLEGHAAEVNALAVLPDGRLASGDDEGTVRVWNLQCGAEPLLFKEHASQINALAVLLDGRLALGGYDDTVWVWDPEGRTEPVQLEGPTQGVIALTVLPDGRLAAGGFDEAVRVWDAQRPREPLLLEGHAPGVNALAMLPDGRLASGDNAGTVRVWDLQHCTEPLLFKGHTSQVNALVVFRDGRLASGASDSTVRVWDPQCRAEPLLFEGHAGQVNSLAILSDHRLAAGANGGSVRVWDPQHRAETVPFEGHAGQVNVLAMLSDGRLASGADDGNVRVWDAQHCAKPLLLNGHKFCVRALAALSDGRLASGDIDGTIRVWDLEHCTEPLLFEGHTRYVDALAMLPNGHLISGSWDYTVRVWDLESRAELLLFNGYYKSSALAVLPDGRIASGADDGSVRVWDPQGHAKSLLLKGHLLYVGALAVLPDGRLASGGYDSTVRVWDLQRRVEPLLLEGHTQSVNALAVLPDGRLASGSNDGTVRVWDPKLCAKPLRFEGHTSRVRALVVLPDGRIASGSDDHSVRVWDLTRQASMSVFYADAFVSCLTVMPSGLIAAGCGDGAVHFLRQAGM